MAGIGIACGTPTIACGIPAIACGTAAIPIMAICCWVAAIPMACGMPAIIICAAPASHCGALAKP